MNLGLSIGLTMRRTGDGYTPATLFAGGGEGAWYDPSDLASMSQNSDGTVPAAVDQPVGRILDKSGNGNHALQVVPINRPVLRAGGYLEFANAFLNHTWSALGDVTLSVSARRTAGTNVQGLYSASPANSPLRAGIYGNAANPNWGAFSGNDLQSAGTSLLNNTLVVTADAAAATGVQNYYTNNGAPVAMPLPIFEGGADDRRIIGAMTTTQAFAGRIYSIIGVGRVLTATERLRLVEYQAAKAKIVV